MNDIELTDRKAWDRVNTRILVGVAVLAVLLSLALSL